MPTHRLLRYNITQLSQNFERVRTCYVNPSTTKFKDNVFVKKKIVYLYPININTSKILYYLLNKLVKFQRKVWEAIQLS